MNNTRVFLSVADRLQEQLIQYSLDRYSDVEIVGRSLNVIEIMTSIAHQKPHVWIHSLGDGPDYRVIRDHLLSIAPDLVMVSVHPDDPCGLIQVPVDSIDELITHALRFAERSESFLTSSHPF